MSLKELQPDLERIREVILDRQAHMSEQPNSTTVRLLQTGWMSAENQTVNTKGELVKPGGIGDKIVEEAVEVGQAHEKDNIILESSQAIYYMMVGCVVMDIAPNVLFKLIDDVYEEQASATVAPDKIAEHAGAAVSRVALAGVSGNGNLVARRTAEAIVSLNRFWEANGISPAEVGREI